MRLAGTEVPITGTDSVKWRELSVPSAASSSSSSSSDTATPFAPPTEDCASCSFVAGSCLIWRIHKSSPHVLELLDLHSQSNGLRLLFPEALCPFAFIFHNQINTASHGTRTTPYSLYAVTVSGIAYLFHLSAPSSYASFSSSSIFPAEDFLQFDMHSYFNNGSLTSIAATSGCLLAGTTLGTILCFHLGTINPTAPGFMHELRDDSGIGRLWGLVSRGKTVGVVQGMVVHEFHGRKLIFALHSDGTLRVWDLLHHSRLLAHTVDVPTIAGGLFKKLWVGEASSETNIIPLAILLRQSSEEITESLYVSGIDFGLGEKMVLSFKSSMRRIPLEEGEYIDIKLGSDNIWILKENGLVVQSLLHGNSNVEEQQYHALQEDFVADQLFISSDHFSDDLLWMVHTALSSEQDNVVSFLSSIFIRRLLHPGVHHTEVLRATLLDYNRRWTDSEYEALTVDAVKKELLFLIEHEGVKENLLSIFCRWKSFCNRYYDHWCKYNAPFGLLFEFPEGGIGIIRKSSVSLFRSVEDIELLVAGMDEAGELSFLNDGREHDVLSEVLHSVNIINQQLGKTASTVFYELLIGSRKVFPEVVVPCFLKVLETGYDISIAAPHVRDTRSDIIGEKKEMNQKNVRKFSVDMLLSLCNLSCKYGTWCRILEAIESYLNFLVPRKTIEELNGHMLNIHSSLIVQATAQIAKTMFDSASDILLFLSYLVHLGSQINIKLDDISRIKFELIPMIEEVMSEWAIINFIAATPSESPALEDFSYQLSSLTIDNNIERRSWNDILGKHDFTLGSLLLVSNQGSFEQSYPSRTLPDPQSISTAVWKFTSWIIWGRTSGDSSAFLINWMELALTLARQKQYNAVELLLGIVEAHLQKECSSRGTQNAKGDWSVLYHLLGCCFLGQAHKLRGTKKEKKVYDAVRCFFRASSGEGAFEALQSLSHESGLPSLAGDVSPATWKFHYYQWAMQIFEQHNISDGACQFAFAAIEQVDEALDSQAETHAEDTLNESAATIKGRLWANVFKFAVDLCQYYDAYCAIISNPDEESKCICLRRFIIVLYERGVSKILCNGQLPFIGLTEKVERELCWKAERSDIIMKQNPYKLLYSFEMHRQNWRRAASYIYRYTARLRSEEALRDSQQLSLSLEERLNGLSAAINALHLVHPEDAWIEPLLEEIPLRSQHYPIKRTKKSVEVQSAANSAHSQTLHSYLDIEHLEREYMLTSAEYLLFLANIKWSYSGDLTHPLSLIDLLVEKNLYDMAFMVLLKFWKGSELKRELEQVFSAMSSKCCPIGMGSPRNGDDIRKHRLLLTLPNDEAALDGLPDIGAETQQHKWNNHWENLELYLGRYKSFHARLPVIVAETLLRSNSQIELPLWLVHMFKGSKNERSWGMAGQESNPASLFHLYLDCGRYTDATNLLLDYLDSFASVRPAQVIYRKRPSAAWFPYTSIERLWCQLEQLIKSGHLVEQHQKLQKLLYEALLSHLKQLKVDSEDVLSSAAS